MQVSELIPALAGLAPARDLLISAAVFRLPPGGSQLIRVALRRPVDPVELSCRLTVQESPQQPLAQATEGMDATKVVLNYQWPPLQKCGLHPPAESLKSRSVSGNQGPS